MSTSNRLYASREIQPHGVATPLLVPSFSSRGFPGLAPIVEAAAPEVAAASLVSLFDLRHELREYAFELLSDILFVDSGAYETSAWVTGESAFLAAPSQESWTREEYRCALGALTPRLALSNTVVVNFDTYAPFSAQAEAAREDFALAPTSAHDFLVKPEIRGQLHSTFDNLPDCVADFHIVGITERELGRSALERCRNLVALRTALDAVCEHQAPIPIHVFGTITPAAIVAYFLCGADVFDGLNWLRVRLLDTGGCAPSEYAVTSNLFEADDDDVLESLWRRNLHDLQTVQRMLRKLATGGEESMLLESFPHGRSALDIARRAASHRP